MRKYERYWDKKRLGRCQRMTLRFSCGHEVEVSAATIVDGRVPTTCKQCPESEVEQ